MLRKTRQITAAIFLAIVTLLFLDFTGSVHLWFGWMAKIQFLPALLALNVGIVLFLVILTLIFGRIYCSIICPLGIFQDVISNMAARKKKNRFFYTPALSWLRYGVLGLFVVALLAGLSSWTALIAPYSAYGRMASNLFAPLYQWGNNLLAYLAERIDSYAFYEIDVWVKGIGTLVTAAVTLAVIFVLAWRGGRSYCNTICPVGTVLGFLSKFSLFKIRIDTEKCNGCGLCARNCKASCIDSKNHRIDHSRCVACFNCIDHCRKHALSYELRHTKPAPATTGKAVDSGRREMLAVAGTLLATSVLKAEEKKVDGGLAFIEDKKVPDRQTPIVPFGAIGIRHFSQHCTACQLCVSVCPNQVLRPSAKMDKFMQPEMSYERGYCRPECTMCSEVCPTGAIRPITKEDKSATQIGHAVWIKKNCIPLTDGVECGNCARHCPAGAITMVSSVIDDPTSPKIPAINTERCIGCGACENLCPSRPFSAIYVEGHEIHRTI